MKKIFWIILIVFAIMPFLIVKAESNIPTIENFTVLVNDDIIEPIEDIYYVDRNEHNIRFNVNEVNTNYCILNEVNTNHYDYRIDCDYQLQNTYNIVSAAEETIQISFVKKSDYDELMNEHENGIYYRDESDLEKYNLVEYKIRNNVIKEYDDLFFTFEYVKDSNGNTINKTNGKYVLDEETNYSFYFKPNKYIEGAKYNWCYTIYNKNQTDSVSKGDEDEKLVNGMLKVDIMFGSSEDYFGIPSDFINILVIGESETGIQNGSSYDFEIEVSGHKYTHFDVEMNYNNNEKVEALYENVWSLKYNSFDNDNPLKLHIKPYYYVGDINANIKLVYYNSNEENDIVLFSKNVTLNNNQDNIIEIPYFEDDDRKLYDIKIIINNDEEHEFVGQLFFSKGYGYINAYTKDPKLFVGFNGSGGYPFDFGKEYELATPMEDIIYIAFKAERLNENEEYHFNVVDDNGNEYSSGYIRGNVLNDNYLYIPVKVPKEGKEIIYYVFIYNSLNEKIIKAHLILRDSQDFWSIAGTLLGDNVVHTYDNHVLIKENSDNLKLYIKGNDYTPDKQYKYFIRFGYNKITGDIMGNEINEGKTISFNYNPNLFDSNNSRTFLYGIEGDNDIATYISFEFVSEAKFNEVKRNGFLTFDENIIGKMNKRAGDTKTLLVDSNGNDVTKNVSYTVKYFKDNDLADTQTINETIKYLEEGITIDTNKVNMVDKFIGYKFKSTSKTDYDEETHKYYLKEIKDKDTLEVYYEKDLFDYSIEYYFDGKKDEKLTVNNKALFKTTINEYDDKAKTGYRLDRTENYPLEISENKNNNIIKVYYERDLFDYSIEYYFDGKKDEKLTVNNKALFKTTISEYDDKAKTGYRLDRTENYPLEISENKNNNIIKVYYEKDLFNYSIEYYFNGKKDEELTVNNKALFKTTINEYDDKAKKGYRFDRTENYPLEISENINNNIIKVYYKVDENNSEQVYISNVKIEKDNNNITITYSKDEFANGYKIYRSESSKGKYKKIANTTETIYIDKKLTYGKTYYYKVKAYNNSNQSISNVVSKKVVPNKVNNLVIISAGTNNVKISYDKVSTTGYEVYMGTKTSNMKKITTITKNSTLTYNKTKLKSNKTYYFKVRAYKTVNGKKVYGPFSDVISTKTAPVKPSLSLSLRSINEMNLKIGFSKGTSEYVVEKSIDGKTYTLVEKLPKEGTLVQGNLEVGKTYYFRVKACNIENRCSSWVAKSLKQTTASPSISLKTSRKKVTVKLGNVDGADGYEVVRAIKKNGKYTTVKSLTNSDELIFDNGTKKGKTYYYKTRSYKIVDGKKVYSPYSSVKKIKSK